MHVMVREGPCWVEVQARTPLQDLWAQIIERLGDLWGRQIRYGHPPSQPQDEIGLGITRESFVRGFLSDISELINDVEMAASTAELRETTVSVGETDAEVEQGIAETRDRSVEIALELRKSFASQS